MSGIGPFHRFNLPAIILGLAVGLTYAQTVAAEEIDPFQINSGHWMSYERYNDNVKRNRPVGNEALGILPAIDTPELSTPTPDSDKKAEIKTVPEPMAEETVSAGPAIAAPTRPLDLPVLPGVNKGYSIQLDSTADNENATVHAQVISKGDGQSDLHLQEQNWQDAAEIARQHAYDKNTSSIDSERPPLDVRMSFLPNPKVIPVFNVAHKPRPRLVELPSTPKPVAAVAEAPKATAECAAVDAYKKQQLEAIQSDRQTLQALQSAITDLGLQKQLDFMTGAQKSSALSASQPQPAATSPPTGMP